MLVSQARLFVSKPYAKRAGAGYKPPLPERLEDWMIESMQATAMSIEAQMMVASIDKFVTQATENLPRSGMDDLSRWKDEYLGKQSMLATLKKGLGSLEIEERKVIGRKLNEARSGLEEVESGIRADIAKDQRSQGIEDERFDLTELISTTRIGHNHLISQTRDALEDVFIGMGYTVAEGPEIETDWYNFEALNIPRDHPARAMVDTFYLSVGAGKENIDSDGDKYLMRAHTSPVQIHVMKEQPPPIYIVAPGRVYRRDTPDARHTPTFHQIEGLVVDKGITFGDLAGTIATFTSSYFGKNVHSRLRPAYFPFTEPSAEFEITCTICSGSGCRTCSKTGWIELGGCGMVDPNVFNAVGIDPNTWSGFAFGFGIDRCAQMLHGIAD
ncbi:MAG TPA: phenylalanine--tRNA ligase subunit alpha, partial [Acidimicrobiales bacterium]|nr:phenylalanine--tRNA ligase subunit alpha [Acidimicrobiales bacterium]